MMTSFEPNEFTDDIQEWADQVLLWEAIMRPLRGATLMTVDWIVNSYED